MHLQLSGKQALVTGSSSGIGESIARTLAREGVTVVVHGRNIERHAAKEVVPTLVGHIGRVEDIANAVTFPASPLADFIDGANLRVDGGNVTGLN
jgi:NAD(P)-dependent dehydrogenase (short-subunit alcohol dehydrogenase family)